MLIYSSQKYFLTKLLYIIKEWYFRQPYTFDFLVRNKLYCFSKFSLAVLQAKSKHSIFFACNCRVPSTRWTIIGIMICLPRVDTRLTSGMSSVLNLWVPLPGVWTALSVLDLIPLRYIIIVKVSNKILFVLQIVVRPEILY